jgi:hypothetical protein
LLTSADSRLRRISGVEYSLWATMKSASSVRSAVLALPALIGVT